MCQFRIKPAPTKPPVVPNDELRKRRLAKVDDDYSCKQKAQTLKRHFDDGSYYIDDKNIDQRSVWNLTHFNLASTRQIIKDVTKVDFLQYPDWRLWYSENYKSYGDYYVAKDNDIQCVVFGDLSFAVGMKDEFQYKLGNSDGEPKVSSHLNRR